MTRIKYIHLDTLSCEPILRKAPDGSLICISQSGGVKEPSPENRVYVFHSYDDGETWTKPESIYPEDGTALYCTEVTVEDGLITAYLTLHTGRFLNWTCIMMQSRDSGITWENAGHPPVFKHYAFLRGKIKTSDGTVLHPYQYYPVSQEANDRELAAGGHIRFTGAEYCESGVLRSTDGGKTYERITASRMEMSDTSWIWSEPTLAELSDGSIVMLMRKCRSGFLWQCRSLDGGKTWSETEKTDIPNPSNKPKLLNLPNGKIALIHTPNNKGMVEGGKFGSRSPLSIWISDDDMKTWGYKRVMTDFPGEFSYSDGFYDDGHIKFSIEQNRRDVLFFDHTIEE